MTNTDTRAKRVCDTCKAFTLLDHARRVRLKSTLGYVRYDEQVDQACAAAHDDYGMKSSFHPTTASTASCTANSFVAFVAVHELHRVSPTT